MAVPVSSLAQLKQEFYWHFLEAVYHRRQTISSSLIMQRYLGSDPLPEVTLQHDGI